MYYAHFVGEGWGCDNTISCNEMLIKIDASSMDEAEDKTRRMFEYDENEDRRTYDPDEIKSVKILEIARESDLSMAVIRAHIKNKQKLADEAKEYDSEKAEYERLKAKFES